LSAWWFIARPQRGQVIASCLPERDVLAVPVASVMSVSPRLALDHELGSAVVHRMEQFGIMAMPVTDDAHRLVGVVHLHDLMRAGAA